MAALYQPRQRWEHSAFDISGNVFFVGGEGGEDVNEVLIPAATVEVFHSASALWQRQVTNGTPPLAVLWSASTAIGDILYHFGGRDVEKTLSNALHGLDTHTMTWSHIQAKELADAGPKPKYGCGMVAHGRDTLVVVGGKVKGKGFQGYTNEVNVFNLTEGRRNPFLLCH